MLYPVSAFLPLRLCSAQSLTAELAPRSLVKGAHVWAVWGKLKCLNLKFNGIVLNNTCFSRRAPSVFSDVLGYYIKHLFPVGQKEELGKTSITSPEQRKNSLF